MRYEKFMSGLIGKSSNNSPNSKDVTPDFDDDSKSYEL